MDLDYFCEQFITNLKSKKEEILRTTVLGYLDYILNEFKFEQKKSVIRCLHLTLGDLSSYVSTKEEFTILIPEKWGKLGIEEPINVCSLLFGVESDGNDYSGLRELCSSQHWKYVKEALERFKQIEPDLYDYYRTLVGISFGYDVSIKSFKKRGLFSKGIIDLELTKKKALIDLEKALSVELERRGIKVFVCPSYLINRFDESFKAIKTNVNDVPPTKQVDYDAKIKKIIDDNINMFKQEKFEYINNDLSKYTKTTEDALGYLWWNGFRNKGYRSTVDLFFVDDSLF